MDWPWTLPVYPRLWESPGVLAAVQHQFQAAHDGAPGHGYAEHFLVGRVRGVRHLNERMHRTVRQPCVNVPKCVRVARLSFEHAHPRPEQEIAARRDGPGEYARVH